MAYIDTFINSVKDGAIASMKKHGVLASITIAQAILESAWGKSELSTKAYNLFGIKRTGNEPCIVMRTGEQKKTGEKYYINAAFRKYNSYAESINDHALFLVDNPRYRENGFFSAKDYVGQANALQKAGYATSLAYAQSLINLIRQFNLNKYDVISYINIDGGGYASYNGGAPGVNLIIRDYSPDVLRVFAWVDSDKGASWAFDLVPPNSNYAMLKKNTSKVITTRNGGYSFSTGSTYKLKVKGYNKDGQVVAENQIVLKIPEK